MASQAAEPEEQSSSGMQQTSDQEAVQFVTVTESNEAVSFFQEIDLLENQGIMALQAAEPEEQSSSGMQQISDQEAVQFVTVTKSSEALSFFADNGLLQNQGIQMASQAAETEEQSSSGMQQEAVDLGTVTESNEASSFFQDIDLLQNEGIKLTTVNMLKRAGIFTLKGIQMNTKRRLSEIEGMNETRLKRIIEAANKLNRECNMMNGLHVNAIRKLVFKIQTGSEELNKLLGGGVESMAFTVAFGLPRTGKTQLSHTLCVTCQRPTETFTGGKVIFIDTENTFRPDRIREIAQRYEFVAEQVLENISYFRAFSSDHQAELLDTIAEMLYNDGSYKLIIIDSILTHFRVESGRKRESSARQQMLREFLSKLQKLSEEYNVAVFGTIQVTGDERKLCPSTVRIALKKAKGNTRIAKLYVAPNLPEAEASFAISNNGIVDVTDVTI